MKYIILLIIIFFTAFALANDTKVYDRQGKFLLTIEKDGRMYNPYGKYLGQIDKKILLEIAMVKGLISNIFILHIANIIINSNDNKTIYIINVSGRSFWRI